MSYSYPGVYIKELSSGNHTIVGASTSVTAFVGQLFRGPVNQPVSISSFADFQRAFGGLHLNSPLSYVVKDFYANGGSQAIVIRVADDAVTPATCTFGNGELVALIPGVWANTSSNTALSVGVTDSSSGTYTLTVYIENNGNNVPVETFTDVTLSSTDYVNRIDIVLQNSAFIRCSTLPTTAPSSPPVLLTFSGGIDSNPAIAQLPVASATPTITLTAQGDASSSGNNLILQIIASSTASQFNVIITDTGNNKTETYPLSGSNPIKTWSDFASAINTNSKLANVTTPPYSLTTSPVLPVKGVAFSNKSNPGNMATCGLFSYGQPVTDFSTAYSPLVIASGTTGGISNPDNSKISVLNISSSPSVDWIGRSINISGYTSASSGSNGTFPIVSVDTSSNPNTISYLNQSAVTDPGTTESWAILESSFLVSGTSNSGATITSAADGKMTVAGIADVSSFSPGMFINVISTDRPTFNGVFLITDVTYSATPNAGTITYTDSSITTGDLTSTANNWTVFSAIAAGANSGLTAPDSNNNNQVTLSVSAEFNLSSALEGKFIEVYDPTNQEKNSGTFPISEITPATIIYYGPSSGGVANNTDNVFWNIEHFSSIAKNNNAVGVATLQGATLGGGTVPANSFVNISSAQNPSNKGTFLITSTQNGLSYYNINAIEEPPSTNSPIVWTIETVTTPSLQFKTTTANTYPTTTITFQQSSSADANQGALDIIIQATGTPSGSSPPSPNETYYNVADLTTFNNIFKATGGSSQLVQFNSVNNATALPCFVQDAMFTGSSPKTCSVATRFNQPQNGDSIQDSSLQLVAINPGSWGNELQVVVDWNVSASVAASYPPVDGVPLTTADLFNLTVTDLGSGITEKYSNLTVKDSPQRIDEVLNNSSKLINVLPGTNLPLTIPVPVAVSSSPNFNYGYDATLSNGLSELQLSKELMGNQADKTGLYALENSTGFDLLCLPDVASFGSTSNNVQPVLTEAAGYCVNKRAFLIVDPPASWNGQPLQSIATVGLSALINDVGGYANTANAAVFFPSIVEADPLLNNALRPFPPCGAVAGVMARTDGTRGVWKAPAGLETGLNGVIQPNVLLSDSDSGTLNPVGVNCIRNFPLQGNVIWGARTLQGADVDSSDWKYISVRRLALYIENSLYPGLQWAVFEPNAEPLWHAITQSVNSFMNGLFIKGAFQGTQASDAYFVKCDNTTTTQADIDQGIVNILVGFAPVKPAEFVVVTIQQIAGQS